MTKKEVMAQVEAYLAGMKATRIPPRFNERGYIVPSEWADKSNGLDRDDVATLREWGVI